MSLFCHPVDLGFGVQNHLQVLLIFLSYLACSTKKFDSNHKHIPLKNRTKMFKIWAQEFVSVQIPFPHLFCL